MYPRAVDRPIPQLPNLSAAFMLRERSHHCFFACGLMRVEFQLIQQVSEEVKTSQAHNVQEEGMEAHTVAPQHVPLWRNSDYMLLWSGQDVSSVGTRVSQLAFPLLVLALTHSPALAGLIGALRGLPYALFILPAGAMVDRWNRKRVMILCDAGRAVA